MSPIRISSVTFSERHGAREVPALLTMMSTLPERLHHLVVDALNVGGNADVGLRPDDADRAVFLIVATASSSASLPRATMATSAPDCASASRREADALLPPVTMAVRPERLISIRSPHDPRWGPRYSWRLPGSKRRKGSSRDLARHDAMDFLARGCADRLVVEQHLG